jgi:hypothetical protein
MNEHNQIVAIHFVQSGDNSEMESILSRIQHRYGIHGYEEVDLFYTDNCCHEYSMIVHAIPSLGHGDALGTTANSVSRSSELDIIHLPENYRPSVIMEYKDLYTFCATLLQSVNVMDADKDVLLGFDVEWDSLTLKDKKKQKPELMQLATADGKHIAVIKLSKVFFGLSLQSNDGMVAKFNALKSLFDHPKVHASGVGVHSDITRFLNDYPEGLVGSSFYRRVFDAKNTGQKHCVIQKGKEKG